FSSSSSSAHLMEDCKTVKTSPSVFNHVAHDDDNYDRLELQREEKSYQIIPPPSVCRNDYPSEVISPVQWSSFPAEEIDLDMFFDLLSSRYSSSQAVLQDFPFMETELQTFN
ncbi:hypothetical protein KI387_002363, partial [Taxus chinensis]